jgi:hypothetical protein
VLLDGDIGANICSCSVLQQQQLHSPLDRCWCGNGGVVQHTTLSCRHPHKLPPLLHTVACKTAKTCKNAWLCLTLQAQLGQFSFAADRWPLHSAAICAATHRPLQWPPCSSHCGNTTLDIHVSTPLTPPMARERCFKRPCHSHTLAQTYLLLAMAEPSSCEWSGQRWLRPLGGRPAHPQQYFLNLSVYTAC